ncbi:CPCC family cysteine-rich protein [Streptomyces exfoliatus]|uniref:CPCC family cysteine-rich protein n=1 Tax=Streptomyces exfoliatus TaxID=1905 RepID=UPI0037AF7AF9
MTGVILKYPCVWCGRPSMDEQPGSYEICPICFWEDDAIQLRWPEHSGGSIGPSLIAAQENYQAFGACEERSVEHVRPPEGDETMDLSWRPIDPERDHFEPRGVQLAVWPDDRSVLYRWRYRNTGFWRPAADRRSPGLFIESGQKPAEDPLAGDLALGCRSTPFCVQAGTASPVPSR